MKPFIIFETFAFVKFVCFHCNVTEFKAYSQPSRVFGTGGMWMVLELFPGLNYGEMRTAMRGNEF